MKVKMINVTYGDKTFSHVNLCDIFYEFVRIYNFFMIYSSQRDNGHIDHARMTSITTHLEDKKAILFLQKTTENEKVINKVINGFDEVIDSIHDYQLAVYKIDELYNQDLRPHPDNLKQLQYVCDETFKVAKAKFQRNKEFLLSWKERINKFNEEFQWFRNDYEILNS